MELQAIVSSHVGDKNQRQVLCENSQRGKPQSQILRPTPAYLNVGPLRAYLRS